MWGVGDNTSVAEDARVDKLSASENVRITKAATRAKLLFPGPVGDFLSRELTSLTYVGFRLDQTGLTERTVTALLDLPLPEKA